MLGTWVKIPSFETVQLDSATIIHLYRPPWAAEIDSVRGVLWVTYYTDCSIRDVACLREEVKRFWPHFRDEAERQRKSTVWFSYADCFGVSSGVSYQRASDGTWSDPWSSRDSECRCSTR